MSTTSCFLFALVTLIPGPVSLCGQATAASVMHEPVDAPFYVAGWKVRTNNANEMGGQGKIGPLWQRFMRQNLAAQIPNRSDDALMVVYSKYASDERGDYDYLLGARVSSVDSLPAGVTWSRVEPGSYAAVLTDKGEMPGVLQAAWKRIWNMPSEELGGKRAFVTDYEIYDARSADPQSAQVEIRVGLAPTSP